MKKNILTSLIIISSLYSLNALAYTVKIDNQTNEQIKVNIDLAAPGICSEHQMLINAGERKDQGTGACCIKKIHVRITSGKFAGKKESLKPTPTGAGIRCKDVNIFVKQTESGALVLEQQ